MDRSAGIGISIAPNKIGQLVVTKIAPDGPAFQSKEIFPGDILVQVNGTLLDGMTLEQVWSFIVGPPNTRVDLQFLRMNDGEEEPEEVYVSIFRSSVASPTLNDSAKFPRLFSQSPGRRDGSLPRSARARSEVQNISPFSQISPQREPVAVRERAWLSPPVFVSGFRDVSPSQRPGPLISGTSPRWSPGSPTRPSQPQPNAGPPGGIDGWGVLRDPRRVSPRRNTPPRNQQLLGVYGTDINYRRAKSAQEARRSWSGDIGRAGQRYFTPQYVRPSPIRDPSPLAKNTGLHGVGIILYNDDHSDLRILEITENGPADSQGCPFLPGDIVVAVNGRYIRGIPSIQARSLILGNYGSPVEISVFRQVQSLESNIARNMLSIPFAIRRGVIATLREAPLASANNPFQSPAASSAHEHRLQGYSTVGPSARTEECGIGVYVEHISGCFVVKSINPTGPASKISPSNLSPGDYIVAIDGRTTQGLTINEVRIRIVGPRGTFVVLHLRRFMSSIGDFSHVFLTRIRRDFALQSAAVMRGTAPAGSVQDALSGSNLEEPLSEESQMNPSTAGYSRQEQAQCGVGIELVALDQVLMIRSIHIGGPAHRSCLVSKGDILHRIDYQAVAGLSVEQAMSLLNGPAKSSVVLGIVKPKHRLRVNVRLQREHIRIKSNTEDTNSKAARSGTGPLYPPAADSNRNSSDRYKSQRSSQDRRSISTGQGLDIPRSTLQFSTPMRGSFNITRATPPLTPFMISPYHSMPRMEYRL